MAKLSKRLRKHGSTIVLLSKSPKGVVKKYLDTAGDDLIKAVQECCHNILSGNVNLTPDEYKRLKRHRTRLRSVRDNSTAIRKKRRIIQTGGFLAALAGPLIGIVGSLISNLIHKRK